MSTVIKGKTYVDHNDMTEQTGLTASQMAECCLKKDIIEEIVKLRNKKKLSQRDLENICGVKQPFIARIEKGNIDPRVTTILKILKPLGMTLAIVSEASKNKKNNKKSPVKE